MAEFRDAIRQHGNAALALGPVPGRQVEQDLRKPVLLQPCSHDIGRMVIRTDVFDTLEARAGSGIKTIEKVMLAKEHRKIG